jgi:pimeloyl-ACP methyl ester carboxylesterase
MPTVTLTAGTIDYDKYGPGDGRPLVFVHGYMMGSSLWEPLAERLAARGFQCIAPTWPLGAHAQPMRTDAELTIEAIAALVGELLDELSLENVILVGNDTGGAIAQVLATTSPPRLERLVLTSCDAFEHFPPPILKPAIAAAKFAPTFLIGLQPLRTRFGRQRAYGALAHADIDPLARTWLQPALGNRGVREDLRRLTASLHQQTMLTAAAGLPGFTKPALIAWSADDAFFPVDDGRRLAAALPDSRLEVIDRSRTFSMIDQPDRLASLIADFADPAASPRAQGMDRSEVSPSAGD